MNADADGARLQIWVDVDGDNQSWFIREAKAEAPVAEAAEEPKEEPKAEAAAAAQPKEEATETKTEEAPAKKTTTRTRKPAAKKTNESQAQSASSRTKAEIAATLPQHRKENHNPGTLASSGCQKDSCCIKDCRFQNGRDQVSAGKTET